MLCPCIRCGEMLHTGEDKVIVAFTPDEMAELACATSDRAVRRRLLCAIALLDSDLARRTDDLLGR